MNTILNYYKKLPWWMRNIYFLLLVFFIVWMLFFDRNNIMASHKISKKLNQLETQKAYYKSEIEKVNQLKEELFSTAEKKEKFAREKYFMKKDNEDIFIIHKKESK